MSDTIHNAHRITDYYDARKNKTFNLSLVPKLCLGTPALHFDQGREALLPTVCHRRTKQSFVFVCSQAELGNKLNASQYWGRLSALLCGFFQVRWPQEHTNFEIGFCIGLDRLATTTHKPIARFDGTIAPITCEGSTIQRIVNVSAR